MEKIQYCECCGQKISKRRKRIDKTLVSALIKSFEHVMNTGEQTFKIRDVLTLNKVEYGILNHLVRFGLLYRSEGMKKGEYGVPRRTVSRFLRGEWRVAEYYETDPTKQEGEEGRREMSERRITINEVPSVTKLREEYGEGLTEYQWNENFE